MPHGDIHEGNQKQERKDHPVPHLVHMFFHRRFPGLCCCLRGFPGPGSLPGGFRILVFTCSRGTVAGVFHCIFYILHRQGGLIKIHLHAVRQQVYADILGAGQLSDTFFHPGRAGGTGHACHIKFLLHNISLPSACS